MNGSRSPRTPKAVTFFVLTFVISWLAAIHYAMGMFPWPVLPTGLFFAAVITAVIEGGMTGLGTYVRRLFRWLVGIGWNALALRLSPSRSRAADAPSSVEATTHAV